MIEIEKKFIVSNEISNNIKNDSVFVSAKTIEDIYYDFHDFRLVKQDLWLRSRNGVVEMKIPNSKCQGSENIDIYDELEDEQKIKTFLKINSFDNLRKIVDLTTQRETYKLGEFTIVFDSVTSKLNDFRYQLMEIEMMATDEDDIREISEKIKNLARKYQLSEGKTQGKVVKYLYEKDREIYDILARK